MTVFMYVIGYILSTKVSNLNKNPILNRLISFYKNTSLFLILIEGLVFFSRYYYFNNT